MSRRIYGALVAALMLGGASLAHAGTRTVDLSSYVNQSFSSNTWFIDGFLYQTDLAGQTTTGNNGSTTPFAVANVADGNGGFKNFWYGLDDGSGTNLFNGVINSITIPVAVSGVTSVHTLADNVFGQYGVTEFMVDFHGAGGDVVGLYVGGDNTRDYNLLNCATTGCATTANAANWNYESYFGFSGLQDVNWTLPKAFGLQSITFTQVHGVDGAILAGVTLGVPEPATWALMIGGFGLMGVALRRRRALALV